MSDRNEQRRQKILNNSKKRFEKLEKLKKSQVDNHSESNELATEEHEKELFQANEAIVHPDAKLEVNAGKESEILKKMLHQSPVIAPTSNEHSTDADITETTDLAESNAIDEKPNWLLKRYRVVLFALLAWIIYLVVVKDFDFVLAYIIGKKLPKDVLSKLFLTGFVGVELQVFLVDVFIKKTETKPSSSSFLMLALRMSGIPASVIEKVTKIILCFGNVVSDLCIYLFVIIILREIDVF